MQESEEKKLSRAEFERLCRETCEGYGSKVNAEAMWFAICKRVYHHLHGYRYDLVFPYTEEPRQQVYQSSLRQMVDKAQSEAFDAVEIAGNYIREIS